MKTFIALSAATALLGACASTAPAPTSGSASLGLAGDYTVTQDGATYTFLAADTPATVSAFGTILKKWSGAGGGPTGYAAVPGTGTVIAAGLENGTYFAGASGTLATPQTGTARYAGLYGVVVNGSATQGNLNLTADFGAGTLLDSSPLIDVNGTISGSTITGTVTFGGETGTLAGGVYQGFAAGSTVIAGAAVGANMAAVISANVLSAK